MIQGRSGTAIIVINKIWAIEVALNKIQRDCMLEMANLLILISNFGRPVVYLDLLFLPLAKAEVLDS